MALFINDVLNKLNLTTFINSYSRRGKAAYHPVVMLKVILLAYATGIASCRKIEQAVQVNSLFIYVAGGCQPSKSTIGWFRLRFIRDLKPLFDQVVQIAFEKGLLKGDGAALDGTKIKANASKHRSFSWGFMLINEPKVHAHIDDMHEKKKQLAPGKSELDDGMNPAHEIDLREKRLELFYWAKKEIKVRAAQDDEKKMQEYEQKMALRQSKIDQGIKRLGRMPKKPETGPQSKDQVNITDPDSRIMPKSGGKEFVQGYNAQAVVDIETMLVRETHITQHTNDKEELVPALRGLETLPDDLGKTKWLCADAGYYSAENVHACTAAGIEAVIAINRQSHYSDPTERFKKDDPPPPEDANDVTKMKHRLTTEDGKEKYKKRKQTIEPVFGIIKSAMGWIQMSMRGLEKCTGEWCLVAIAYNLKRMSQLLREEVNTT